MNCVEYSQKRGVSLQIEPINKSETNILNNVYETLEFIDGLGNPENLGLLYDTYHSNIEDGGMIEAIKAAAGRIKNVHFADSDRGLPGYGTLDFPKIFKAVIDTGYQGAFALETLSKPSVEFVRENCASSILQIVRP
jgi:sugar phosphate isomerase/epimerase